MSLCSFEFLAAFSVLVILVEFCRTRRERQLLFTGANLLFLYLVASNSLVRYILLFFVAGTYVLLRFIKATHSGKLVGLFIINVLMVYANLKQLLPADWLLPAVRQLTSVEIVGLSYMLFKFIDALVHQWQDETSPCEFLCYVSYQLAFFTLLAGPIQRYRDFQESWNGMAEPPPDVWEPLTDYSRILTGLIKLGGIAPLIDHFLVTRSFDLNSPDLPARFLAHFYAYPIFLYFNFSGYTDVAIGCGKLLGFSLPENFNRPFSARNLLDFWSRWHMSLTQWVRDFVFIPSYKLAAGMWPRWSKLLGYLLLGVAMFVVGIWHGFTAAFVAFGLINGIGVAVTQAYGDGLKSLLGRVGWQRYQRSALIRWAAWTLTFHFTCFAFLFFSLDFAQVLTVLPAALGQAEHFLKSWQPIFFTSGLRLDEFSMPILLCVLFGLVFVGLAFATSRYGLWLWHPAVVVTKSALVTLMFLVRWLNEQPEAVAVYGRF